MYYVFTSLYIYIFNIYILTYLHIYIFIYETTSAYLKSPLLLLSFTLLCGTKTIRSSKPGRLRLQFCKTNQTLARLVTTRCIVVFPTAKSLGYFWMRREEGGVDPNRDFPYEVTDETKCMRTVAALKLNEVFRDQLFQSAVNFRGGIDSIAY